MARRPLLYIDCLPDRLHIIGTTRNRAMPFHMRSEPAEACLKRVRAPAMDRIP